MSNYRVKYRDGNFEIEVESTEKAYVDDKLAELLSSQTKPAKPPQRRSPNRRQSASNSTDEDSGQVDVAAIVEAISDSDDYDAIDTHILSKVGQLARIIMCLKFASTTLESPQLTTGNIELITDQLGIKITPQNAGKVIKRNLKYFTASSVRRQGAIIKYKLNRKGLDAYDKLLKGEKLS